jgi:hypothetical protein
MRSRTGTPHARGTCSKEAGITPGLSKDPASVQLRGPPTLPPGPPWAGAWGAT